MNRFVVLVILYSVVAKPAFAYIDAAIGGLLLQSLAAGLVTFMMIWRTWIDKVKAFFRREDTATDQSPAPPE